MRQPRRAQGQVSTPWPAPSYHVSLDMGRRPTKFIKRIKSLRAKLWPDVTQERLWHRESHDGFTTVPRTLPLICSIIDDLTKGAPASPVYLELWCRAYDEMYVSLSKSKELAFHSGFVGQRAERTWADRIRKLNELGFISVKPGQAGPLSHALILNPYLVVKQLYDQKYPGLTENKYIALLERAEEIGANDLDVPGEKTEEEEDEFGEKKATATGST